MKLPTLILPLVAWLALLSSASAQDTQYFLKLDGIPGESTNAQHPNEIDVLSASLAVLQPQMQKFVGSAASPAKTEINPVTITKFIDKSSPKLFLNCATGTRIPSAVLTARRSVAGAARDFYTITL